MSRGFQLQVLSISGLIWYRPDVAFSQHPKVIEASSVNALRDAIRAAADERTLSFAEHVRIVTDDGHAVERWKITPGRAKKLRRRF